MPPLARVEDALQAANMPPEAEEPASEPASKSLWTPLGPPRTAPGSAAGASGADSRAAEPGAAQGAFQPSLRNIVVRRRTGETLTADLARYRRTGDLAANPYLQDGDLVQTPHYNTLRDVVRVAGDAPQPGDYEHRAGDTVRDVLLLAGLPEAEAAGLEITLQRAGGPAAPAALDAAVGPRDQIHVRQSAPELETASIYGRVQRPGAYFITPGRTTLTQLVALAGGLREGALTRLAYILRAAPQGDPADARVRLAADLRQLRDYDLATRTFFYSQVAGGLRVSVDVAGALSGAAPDVALRDGDQVVIPEDDQAVLVLGNVSRPGYVPYKPQETAAYYLAAAGGALGSASAVVVFDAQAKQLSGEKARTVIAPGDLILAPGRNQADSLDVYEASLSEQRYQLELRNARSEARSRRFQTAASLGSVTISILTTYLLIADRLK